MARAMKCDICGKLYEMYNVSQRDTEPNMLTFRKSTGIPNDSYPTKSYDLCPECMHDLQDFIKILGARKS